jgi:osmotically-inducible protein OsmY
MRMRIGAISVRNGTAEMTGWVTSGVERRAIHVLAENLPGVTKVKDELIRSVPDV